MRYFLLWVMKKEAPEKPMGPDNISISSKDLRYSCSFIPQCVRNLRNILGALNLK